MAASPKLCIELLPTVFAAKKILRLARSDQRRRGSNRQRRKPPARASSDCCINLLFNQAEGEEQRCRRSLMFGATRGLASCDRETSIVRPR
jgi:hypothetical protein